MPRDKVIQWAVAVVVASALALLAAWILMAPLCPPCPACPLQTWLAPCSETYPCAAGLVCVLGYDGNSFCVRPDNVRVDLLLAWP